MKNVYEFLNEEQLWIFWRQRLFSTAIGLIEWEGLPDNFPAWWIERTLVTTGKCLFAIEPELGSFIGYGFTGSGNLDIFGMPVEREVQFPNGYHARFSCEDSVICLNNPIQLPDMQAIQIYAARLTELTLSHVVNARNQRQGVVYEVEESQVLTMRNMLDKLAFGEAQVLGKKIAGRTEANTILPALPFTADKIYQEITNVWNEFLTFMGVPNLQAYKKERMLKDEVNRLMGGAIASQSPRLSMREWAAEQFNEMFGTSIKPRYAVNGKEDGSDGELDYGRFGDPTGAGE